MRHVPSIVLVAVCLCGCDSSDDCTGINGLEVTAYQCQDSIDNDGDGLIDCADEDCQLFIFCDWDTDTDSETETETETEPDAGGDPDGGLDGGNL